MNQFTFYNTTSIFAGDSDYDHIVPILQFDSKYTDGLYHADDVIHFSDNGESACIGAKNKNVCNDTVPPFIYKMTVSDFIGTRVQANNKTGPLYRLPVIPYGIAHTGIIDVNKDTLPIQIKTSSVYENPPIKQGSETRPTSTNVTLNVTISKMVPSMSYKLYKYDNETLIPTSKFNLNAKNAVTVKTILSPNGTFTFYETITTNKKAFYRCVPTTAP